MSKKKITDPEGSMEELISRAVEAAKTPFTPNLKAELPSLRSVAEELGTTVIRTRKRGCGRLQLLLLLNTAWSLVL